MQKAQETGNLAQSCSLTPVSAADKTSQRLLGLQESQGGYFTPLCGYPPEPAVTRVWGQHGATVPRKKGDQTDPKPQNYFL